jgi:hypothetical protein
METVCFIKRIGELPNYRRFIIIKLCLRNADIKAIGTGKNKYGFTEVNLQTYMVCPSPRHVKITRIIIRNLPQKVDGSSAGQEMPRGSWVI